LCQITHAEAFETQRPQRRKGQKTLAATFFNVENLAALAA